MSDYSFPHAEPKEWVLEPETEYRFELDPGTSLAIKVCRLLDYPLLALCLSASQRSGTARSWKRRDVWRRARRREDISLWLRMQGCCFHLAGLCDRDEFFQPSLNHMQLMYSSQHVTGRPSTEYVSEETPMTAYANLHMAFEQMRVRALRALHGSPVSDDDANASTESPRVLILGPENSGKTTICKILVNYAVRVGQNWSPVLVNVDPGEVSHNLSRRASIDGHQGAWTVPGTISAAAVTSPIATVSPVSPLGSAATTAPTVLASNALTPLAYWYGNSETKRNPLLLDRLIRNLGENVLERLDNDPEVTARTSGLIVDTPSSFASGSGAGSADSRYALIKACVDAFRINVILVVGHEKLNVEMQRLYGSRLTVVKIPKSGGVVELDHSYRERVHNYQLHSYMYGQKIDPPSGITSAIVAGEAATDLVLSPSSSIIKFGDITIYRIGEETMAPSSALPIGATRTLSEMQPIQLDPASVGSGLLNRVLAVLVPFHPDESERYDEEILDLPVSGFLVM
ncbi:hypothetical protein ID866_7830 [Astraeus odoratus]|nr:hypothetical protein ID866_7830 [Astraeus odoratus]